MSYLRKDWWGIVGVILKEGLAGHSWCHTQKKDWWDIFGVISKRRIGRDSGCHVKRRIGGA